MEDKSRALSPSSALRSPEPSGTPVLKGRSSHMPPVGVFHLDHEPPVSIEEKWEHADFGDAEGEAAAIHAEYELCTWNPYASEDRECKRERYEKDDDKGGMATCQQVSIDVSFQKDENLPQAWNSLPSLSNIKDKNNKTTGSSYPNQAHLNKVPGQSEAAALQSRFADLFNKVAGLGSEGGTAEITHNSKRQGQQIVYLQRKMKELQEQLAEEKRQRQMVAQRLAEERQTSERASMERQELWETKLKELQKEKYALSIRLQELEAETPRKRIAKGVDTVLLTGDELKRLKQEIWEQESLIRGYQVENQKAVERMKELELEAKEKQKLMAEENASLASQLANMQLSVRQSLNHGAGMSVESSLRNAAGLEAHARELKLKLENEKLLQVISDLERTVAEMNSNSKQKQQNDDRYSTAVQVNEELTSENAILAKEVHEQAELLSELQARLERQQKLLECRAVSDPPLALENGQASSRRIKRVTEQVADVRSFYIKKIRDLTKRLEEAGQENKKKTNSEILKMNAADSVQMKEMKQMKEQIKIQANTIKALNLKLSELDKIKEVQEIHSNCSTREAEMHARQKQKEQKSSSNVNETTEGADADARKESVHEVELLQLERKKLEEQNHDLEERLRKVSKELVDLESTPRASQLTFLKRRIEEMEEHHKHKETEWQEILKETKKVYGIEQDMIERRWELALEAKNAEVERFRLELDTILENALKIQASQIQAVKGCGID